MKHLNGRVAHYVLDLCDQALGLPGTREHGFEWLRGDPPPGKTQGTRLRVDSCWPELGLVVEVNEQQHDEPSPFIDRRPTVSGVGRGEQRRLYDLRRATLIPANGLRLVIIRPSQLSIGPKGGRKPDRGADLTVVRQLLA